MEEMKKKNNPKITHSLNSHDKDTNSSRNIRAVRKLFLSGEKFTARQINDLVGFNDARKVISDLRRKEGMNILDVRLDDRHKLYWLSNGEVD